MKLFKYLSIVLLAVVLFTGCKPDELKPIGDARNVVKQMTGSFTLSKVTQIDNDAVKNEFPYRTMDITRFYAGASITFNTGTDGIPTTFTLTTAAGSNALIGVPSGNWSVDDINAPKVLSFKSGAVTETLEMGTYIALDNKKLKLQRIRRSGDKVLITYDFEFTKN